MKKMLQQLGGRLLKNLRRLWRKRKNLLVVRFVEGELVAAYWQQGILVWQEQLALEVASLYKTEAVLKAMETKLRELLLDKEVEENVYTLLVPPALFLRTEQLELPLLNALELRQAVSWEAANAFGGHAYSYAYLAQEEEDSCTLHLWGLEEELLAALEQLGASLLLELKVVACLKEEQLAEAWYGGEAVAEFQRQQQAFVPTPRLKKLLVRTAGAVLCLSLAGYAGAWLGCYLAQKEVRAVQSELAASRLWRERQQASAVTEKKIAQLEKQLAQQKKAMQQRMSGELERLSKAAVAGCWLTQVVQEHSSVQLEGRAVDMQALQAFMDSLQQSGGYKSVELRQSQARGTELEYSLQLERREDKQ